jgi:hypothetical protein
MTCRNICKQILTLDRTIRFAGIASMKGKILAAEYRKGLTPLLTRGDSELSIIQSVIRMSSRSTLEEKLGKIIYAFALYQKVKRVSIMLYDERGQSHAVVMVSLDREANHDSIIMEKILPYLKTVGRRIAE